MSQTPRLVPANAPMRFASLPRAVDVHQGLHPEHKYELRVQAVNAIGAGPLSDASEPTWTLGRPSVAPSAPRLIGATVTSVDLEWPDATVEVCRVEQL